MSKSPPNIEGEDTLREASELADHLVLQGGYKNPEEVKRLIVEARIDEINRIQLDVTSGLQFESEDEYGNPVLHSRNDRISHLNQPNKEREYRK